MSNLTNQLSELSPEGLQDLAARLLAKRTAAKRPLEDNQIRRSAQPGLNIPLSSAQEGLWLQEGFGAGTAYNESIALHIEGELDAQVLERSLAEIIRRHDVLRSRIVTTEEGTGQQVVVPPDAFQLKVVDFRFTASELEECVRRYAAEELAQPFDVAHDSLVVAHLLQFGRFQHVLCWSAHHIVWDLWSLGVMLTELDTLYANFVNGRPSPLAPLEVQYADYSLWQREWLLGNECQQQVTYWNAQLAGTRLPLELPVDKPRLQQSSFRSGRLWFSVPLATAQSLKELSRRESATPFMTLLAAFQLLLSRWSGHRDIVVGSPIAGRKRKPTESLIGLFVNLLALRAHLYEHLTFRQLLAQVRKTTLGAFANQEVPFEQLAGALYGERHSMRQPLQVIFAMQNHSSESPSVAGLKTTMLEIETQSAKFELLLEIFETDAGLSGRLEYAEDQFKAEAMERLMECFQALLSGVAVNPDGNIHELPLLSERRNNQVLVEWNKTARLYPTDRCVHELFEEQVKLTPNAVAVVCGGESLTYSELNRRSNGLARYLLKKGIQIGEPIGLLMDRSPRMIIALLAIVKAGGAYLPIDSLYPASRIEHLLLDGVVRTAFTDHHHESKIHPTGNVQVIVPEMLELAQHDTADLRLQVPPEGCVYIIYTSGSTGGPKGVAVPHTAVNRLVKNSEYVPLSKGLSILSTGSVAFDASTFEIWGSLLNGGRLILPQERVLDGEALLALQREHAIDSAFLTSALFNSILDTTPDALAGIRHLIVGGEALSTHHVARAVRQLPETSLYNAYGPTESTTFASIYPVPGKFNATEQLSVPIGKPIANTQMYILDHLLNPVPTGVEGELFISGAGLALCYWNQPALTAEKFLPNPFVVGERMYRTGDRARFQPDGNIVFAGRVDFQVKVRGFRVELGEIERVLLGHPAVRQACVVAREGSTHRKLVAYVVADRFDSDQFRSHLLQSLPEYMVPLNFVKMSRLPVNHNGKVDIRALPEPEADEALQDNYMAPGTPTEAQLCDLFAATLNLERIGIHDNFFAAGGDSILAIQIVARAKLQGIVFSMRDLFRLQTVAKVAKSAVRAKAVSTSEKEDRRPFPLTATPLKVLQFMGQDFIRNVPVTVWECSRKLSPAVLKQAVHSLVGRHDALRLRLMAVGDSWALGGTSADAASQDSLFEFLDCGDLRTGSECLARVRENATRLSLSVDPREPPLLRVMLLGFGEAQPQRLLLAIHHLGFDPVSLTILLHDLEQLYRGYENEKEVHLPQQLTSYQSWARRIAEYSDTEEIETQREYWYSLPWDRCKVLPREEIQQSEGLSAPDSEVSILTQAETEQLFETAQRGLGMQVEDVLLTALAVVLADWTGSRVVLIDRMHHGRVDLFPDLDVSQTVGWFSTEVPVVLDLSRAQGMKQYLDITRDHVSTLGNSGISYGVLRYQKVNPAFVSIPTAEVRLNHLGKMGSDSRDSLFRGRFDELETEASSKLDRLIEVRTMIHSGSLQLQWLYDRAVHSPGTIQNKAAELVTHLRTVSSVVVQTDKQHD